ncbi:type II secretion system minor pseudopilin GspH [Vibrio paucivorans]
MSSRLMPSRGFTLIEILLVLVLLAVSAVAVIASLPNSSEDTAKKDAQSLFHRMQLLNEEAILSGKDFGLRVDEKQSGYALMALASDGWQLLDMDGLPAETHLDDRLSIQMTLGGDAWRDDDRLFNPGSLFDEDMFADVEKDKKTKPPQIFIMSSGEVTPVNVAFYPSDKDAEQDSWTVVVKENSQILLLAPGESLDE